MSPISVDSVSRQGARLGTLFGWVFGLGAGVLFTQIMYIPLKRVVFAIGSSDIATASEGLGTLVIQCLPAIMLLAAIRTAQRLFRTYATGGILTADSSRLLGRVGDWLTASAVLSLIVGPASARMDAVTGGYITTQIALICVGVAIRLVGQVQALAAQIKSDHEQIV